ncbi:MAG TPA: hypothetical protein VKM54_16650 [Myxococcota bacterium]|nr:hypothetical protein [Myxococcota bacterium]
MPARRNRRPGGRRTEAGRKPVDPGRPLARPVMVRLAEDDFAAIKNTPGDEGLGAFIRRIILDAVGSRRRRLRPSVTQE